MGGAVSGHGGAVGVRQGCSNDQGSSKVRRAAAIRGWRSAPLGLEMQRVFWADTFGQERCQRPRGQGRGAEIVRQYGPADAGLHEGAGKPQVRRDGRAGRGEFGAENVAAEFADERQLLVIGDGGQGGEKRGVDRVSGDAGRNDGRSTDRAML